MWARLGQIALKYLIIPIAEYGGRAIYSYVTEYFRRKKEKEDALKKGSDYAKAPDANSAQDSFNRLP